MDRTTGDQLIVVQVTDQQADEYVVKHGRYSEQTVYDFNSRYDFASPEDEVVECVYPSSVPANCDVLELTEEERQELIEHMYLDDETYAFPDSRLE